MERMSDDLRKPRADRKIVKEKLLVLQSSEAELLKQAEQNAFGVKRSEEKLAIAQGEVANSSGANALVVENLSKKLEGTQHEVFTTKRERARLMAELEEAQEEVVEVVEAVRLEGEEREAERLAEQNAKEAIFLSSQGKN